MKLFGRIESDEDLVNKKYVDDATDSAKEVFIAKQGETTASELKAAYAANKVILIVPSGTAYTSWSWVVCGFENNNSTTCELACVFLNGMNFSNGLSIIKFIVNGSNWTFTSQGVQNKLISGKDIKTINNQSLLGSGNIDIQGGSGGGTLLVKYEETTYDALKEAYETGMSVMAVDPMGFSNYVASISYMPINPPEVDGYEVGFLSGGYPYTWQCVQTNGVVEWTEIKYEKYATLTETGKLTDLTTDNKDNLVNAINEVYEKSGEPFRVKQWGSNALNVEIPTCTEDISNTAIPKMVFSIDNVEGADYQIVGMLAYEVFDAASGGNRINCWPVCQFTGNGQKELSVRWMCGGTTRKTAKRINAWVLLKHR